VWRGLAFGGGIFVLTSLNPVIWPSRFSSHFTRYMIAGNLIIWLFFGFLWSSFVWNVFSEMLADTKR